MSQNDLIFENKILDKQGAAKFLGMSVSWINKEMANGLPYIKQGRSVRFRVKDLIAWQNERSVNV